jgi:hypothetical protein
VPPDSGVTWAGRAFGLTLRSSFPLPGLSPSPVPERGDRELHLSLAAPADLDRHGGGYRFAAAGAGLFELAADGSSLVCAPERGAGWRWRRFVVGQALPFAAVLQGLEVFHASAVEIDGGAVALVGPSGVGKSTLALNLHLAGAGFITDDVLALELQDGEVLAHPGMPLVKTRAAAQRLIAATDRLGSPVSADAREVRHEVPTVSGPLPLAAFCRLERDERIRVVEVDEIDPDPRGLLGSTFNLLVSSAARRSRQLDLCAELAAGARVLQARVPARPDTAAAAALRDRLACVQHA